jgi:hypothetical protein
VNRIVLASPPLVWIGLISYPLYLWHWPLLVFGEMIKFRPLTLLERDLILLASTLLAWATYRFVEIPFRFGLPSRRKMFSLGAGMAMVAVAGMGRHLGAAASTSGCRRKSAPWRAYRRRASSGGFTNALLDLSQGSKLCRHLRRARSASAGPDLGRFDRWRPAARACARRRRTRGFGIAQLTVQFLHSGVERRHREHAELPRDE